MKEKTVVIGMSGGVDSSVAACLLKDAGYNVIGATMLMLDDEKTKTAIADAKKICKQIQIPHYIFDVSKEFKELVINCFIDSYKEGKTPNPCVVCNKKFKFGLFYQKAQELNANYIATGHYAKIENNHLVMSEVKEKDQSYFLCQIEKEVLPHILFPLNKYKSKDEIRDLARKYQLPVSEKKDSQEICFIPNDNYKKFLNSQNLKCQEGKIILKENGKVLGTHNGLYNYTIGQRKGLNISFKEPLYVIELDSKTNTVIVGKNEDLFKETLKAENMNYLVDKTAFFNYDLFAKVRSRGSLEKIKSITEEQDGSLNVTFEKPQRAITPGQLIVFYNTKNECLGGGYIIK